jgi:Beta-galactosidase
MRNSSNQLSPMLRVAIMPIIAVVISPAISRQASDQLSASEIHVWQVPASRNPMPHFEEANGRKVLYVDGWPFTVLAVEIPWWDLIYGRYKETQTAYDNLYPAAAKLGLNALKVPIKWSMVEPEKGIYDFSYLDHVKELAEHNHLRLVLNWFGHYASADGTIYGNLTGEVYAPMYIVADEKTYPRAVDADGVAHHNAISYDYEPILEREIAAFQAFMRHIKEIDSQTHTIVMIQVENEIAVFGEDRHNPKLWRDHSTAANQRFKDHGFADDLKFSAWDLSYNWIRRLTDAGAAEYPLPFFHNYVGGKVADWMVGGAPGEDVETYLKNCPNISFVGVNSYFCAEWRPDNSCARASQATVEELRESLRRYHVGRNLPAITEINSGSTPVTSRLAYIAVGEFGAPIYAPWALTVSYPEAYEPYILADGSEANGAVALRETYESLSKALPQISYYAATDKQKVFMADSPGQRFTQTESVNGFKVRVRGEHDGKAIVIHLSDHNFLVIGYRANISWKDTGVEWPQMKSIHVERVRWSADHWIRDGEPEYGADQSHQSLELSLEIPQAVMVAW